MLNEANAINITGEEQNVQREVSAEEILASNPKPFKYLLWINSEGNVLLIKDEIKIDGMRFIYSINNFSITNRSQEKDYCLDIFCFKDEENVYGIVINSEIQISRGIIDILVEGILNAMMKVESESEDVKKYIIDGVEPLSNILLTLIKISKSGSDIDKMFEYDKTEEVVIEETIVEDTE